MIITQTTLCPWCPQCRDALVLMVSLLYGHFVKTGVSGSRSYLRWCEPASGCSSASGEHRAPHYQRAHACYEKKEDRQKEMCPWLWVGMYRYALMPLIKCTLQDIHTLPPSPTSIPNSYPQPSPHPPPYTLTPGTIIPP